MTFLPRTLQPDVMEREAAAAEALAERLALGAFPLVPEPARAHAVRFWDERARWLRGLYAQLHSSDFVAVRDCVAPPSGFLADPGRPRWADRLTDDEARDPRARA